MFKVTSIFFLLFYLLPFTFFLTGTYWFEATQVIVVCLFFFLGALVSIFLSKGNCIADHSTKLIPSPRTLNLVAAAYLVLRTERIFEAVTQIFSGNVSQWLLNNAIDRYSGNENVGVVDQVGTILFFTYALLLGARGNTQGIYRSHYFMLFLGFILIESTELARAVVVLALCAFFGEYLIRCNARLTSIGLPRIVGLLLFSFVLLTAVFLFSGYFRLKGESDLMNILFAKANLYTFAIYEALLVWMKSLTEYEISGGYYTFTFLWKVFGEKVPQGFYSLVDTSYGYTNIFTSIRGYLSDFGIIGSAIFFSMIGFTVHHFSRNTLSYISYFFLRMSLASVFFVLIPPFSFTTFFAAYVLSFFLLLPIPFPRRRRRRPVDRDCSRR